MAIYMVNDDTGAVALLCEDDVERAEALLYSGFRETGKDEYEQRAHRLRDDMEQRLAGGVGYE